MVSEKKLTRLERIEKEFDLMVESLKEDYSPGKLKIFSELAWEKKALKEVKLLKEIAPETTNRRQILSHIGHTNEVLEELGLPPLTEEEVDFKMIHGASDYSKMLVSALIRKIDAKKEEN